MKEIFLTALRDKKTPTELFRQAAHQLALLQAIESSRFLPQVLRPVQTPLASTQGAALGKTPILVAILRSGLVLLPAFLSLYPGAPIGCIGIQRDEKTATPHLYSFHIPPLDAEDWIFLLDPMIATGQSATLAIERIKQKGASESKILLISFLAAPQGLSHIQKHCPHIHIQIVHIDERLDAKHWIVPGLGDFGDRYFGT